MDNYATNTNEQGSCGGTFNTSSAVPPLAPFTYQTWMAAWDKIGYLKNSDTNERVAYDDIVDSLPVIPEGVSNNAYAIYLRIQMEQLEMRTIDIPHETFWAMREELQHRCNQVHPALSSAPKCLIDIHLDEMQAHPR
jgi:hypothetical protein